MAVNLVENLTEKSLYYTRGHHMTPLAHDIQDAVSFIRQRTDAKPSIGIILGSGLGDLAHHVENPIVIPYREIPHFAQSAAIGHANQLIIGTLAGKQVVLMKGRFHYYEGYPLVQVTFPVRVMEALGIHSLIVTNACGAINMQFKPGELMVITDHLNLTGANPLMGANEETLGVRFVDLSHAYDPDYRHLALSLGQSMNIPMQQGVYAWWTGPTYETPAEIRMIRTLGGDAVGMSTVPEVIVARHAGLRVLGISCLTNMAAGILPQPLSHHEVIEVANQVAADFQRLVTGIVEQM